MAMGQAVGIDQDIVEQTAQAFCDANFDLGFAIIERHAKDEAGWDLTEKLCPAFATSRTKTSI